MLFNPLFYCDRVVISTASKYEKKLECCVLKKELIQSGCKLRWLRGKRPAAGFICSIDKTGGLEEMISFNHSHPFSGYL